MVAAGGVPRLPRLLLVRQADLQSPALAVPARGRLRRADRDDLHRAAGVLFYASEARHLRRHLHRLSGDRLADLHVRRARALSQRAPGVSAVPHRHADPVPARRGAGLFRGHAARHEVLPVDAADRRHAGADPSDRAGERISLADHGADPGLRHLLPAPCPAHAARARGYRHRRRAQALSPPRDPRRVHRRRGADAARPDQPDLARDPDHPALRALDLRGEAGREEARRRAMQRRSPPASRHKGDTCCTCSTPKRCC